MYRDVVPPDRERPCHMALLKKTLARTQRHNPTLPRCELSFLNSLRIATVICRARLQTDRFEACALLHVSHSVSTRAHAEALVQCLSKALDKPARLLAPGTDELSFDEHWLLGLARAHTRGDDASVAFLLGRRVRPENRRLVAFLIGQLTVFSQIH